MSHPEGRPGREYEMFLDQSYYDYWCVRRRGVRDFNSVESWHFTRKDRAEALLELLREAK